MGWGEQAEQRQRMLGSIESSSIVKRGYAMEEGVVAVEPEDWMGMQIRLSVYREKRVGMGGRRAEEM